MSDRLRKELDQIRRQRIELLLLEGKTDQALELVLKARKEAVIREYLDALDSEGDNRP